MPVHYIEKELCKDCGLCVYYCPNDVLRMTPRRNKKGFNVVEVANPQECIGCKMCEINCPDFVIHVIKKAASDA